MELDDAQTRVADYLDDKLQTAGDAFEVAPYGIPVAKGSAFTPVLQKALQSLIDLAESMRFHSGALYTSLL